MVKKYLLFALTFLSITSYFSFFHTNALYAVGINEQCNGDDRVPPSSRGCSAIDGCIEMVCDPGLKCSDDAVCVPRDVSQQLECNCLEQGQDGNNGPRNGFKCGTDPNAPIVYCNDPDQACYEGDAEIPPSAVNKTDPNHYANATLRGVQCTEPRTKAICNCVGTGLSGANNFECYKEGEDPNKKTATGFCKNGAAKCVAKEGTTTDSGSVWEFTGFLEEDSSIITGISCESQADTEKELPTVPPPPPPPCAQPIVNGECPEFSSAVGVLGTAPEKFIASLFAVLLSISGGIALLLIIKSGYQMLTSRGNPEGINNGRDQLVAAIVGLIFLIFSFVILQVIGFDILRIPGFS